MALPTALTSPNAQSPSSLPSTEVSGESDVTKQMQQATPAMGRAPAAHAAAPQADPMAFMDQAQAPAAQPQQQPTAQNDPLSFMDSTEPPPSHVVNGNSIIQSFKDSPVSTSIIGGTLMSVLAAPVAVASGPFAPAVEMGAFGLGAAMANSAVRIADTAQTALPILYNRGKEFVDKLTDSLSGDKKKMMAAYGWFQQGVQALPNDIADFFKQAPQALDQAGADFMSNATAVGYGQFVGGALARYGAQKFASEMGTTIQDLNAAHANYQQVQALAGKIGIDLPVGMEGAGMVHGPLTEAAARNQATWRQAAKGAYGPDAQTSASAMLREVQGQIENSFKSTLGQYAEAKGGQPPAHALDYHMAVESQGEKSIRESLMAEYGDKYTPAEPQRIQSLMDEPLRMFMDEQGNISKQAESRMNPEQKQWLQAREVYMNKLQDYKAGMQGDIGMNMAELRELGQQSSSFQGQNPVSRSVGEDGIARWNPGVDVQSVNLPNNRGGRSNIPFASMEGVTSSELNLPTQTAAGHSQVGGTPTKNLTLRQMDQLLNDFQDVTYNKAKGENGEMKRSAAKLRIEFNDSMAKQLPQDDARVGWFKEANDKYSAWVNDFSDMNDLVQKFPHAAVEQLVPTKNVPFAERKTSLVFEHLEPRTQDQVRKGFLSNIQEQASAEKGRIDPFKLQSLMDQYTPKQLDQVFGKEGASKDLQNLVNIAKINENIRPEITGVPDGKKFHPVIQAAIRFAQSAGKGVGSVFTGELSKFIDNLVMKGQTFEKTLQGMDYQNQLRAALDKTSSRQSANVAPVRGLVGKAIQQALPDSPVEAAKSTVESVKSMDLFGTERKRREAEARGYY